MEEKQLALSPEVEEKIRRSFAITQSIVSAGTKTAFVKQWERDREKILALDEAHRNIFPYVWSRCKAQGMEDDAIRITTEEEGEIFAQAVKDLEANKILDFFPLNPSTRTIINEKFINDLQNKEEINEGEYDALVSRAVAGKNKHPDITAWFKAETDLDIKSIEEFDRDVHDAVVTLYKCAKESGLSCCLFDVTMVYENMPGGGEKQKPGPQLAKEISLSLERLRRLYIDADFTEEAHARGFNKELTYTVDGLCLKLRKVKARYQNGVLAGEAYLLEDEPPLLSHAMINGQYITAPGSHYVILTEDGKKVRMTKTRMEIAAYLYRRIRVMKNDREKARERQKKRRIKGKPVSDYERQSHAIRIETIFANSHLGTVKPQVKSVHLSFILLVLENWVRQKVIEGYTTNKKGKTIYSVEIIL